MLKGTLRPFRVEGIPVDIHWTWLFVFVLVFWSLATYCLNVAEYAVVDAALARADANELADHTRT